MVDPRHFPPVATPCEGCGKTLAAARLNAVPAARRCVGCQALVERRVQGAK